MKKDLRLILTMLSIALLLGGVLAVTAIAASDKNPQGTPASATPKPTGSGDDHTNLSTVTPTVVSPGNGTPEEHATATPAPQEHPTATPAPASGPGATVTPKPTNTPNEEKNENNEDEENSEPTATPAPPAGLLPSYSFIPNSTVSMYVDGFGPVPVMSVQLSTGQSVTIPIAPYNPNMVWGTFGTYANWAAQFQAVNGRPPTDQDAVNFWISQALAGQLKVSPTP